MSETGSARARDRRAAHRNEPARPGTDPAARHLRSVRPDESEGLAVEVTAAVRSEVVARMRRMSVLHTRAFWEQRRRDRLSPHAVAFFYLQPDAPMIERLRTATRIFLADDDATDLPQLLHGMAEHAYDGYRDEPGFDPRTRMCNRCEPMTADAVFVGVGVATLDTPYGGPVAAERRAHNELELPGRGFARMIDGTYLLMDRGGKQQFNQLVVACSVNDENTRYGTPSMQWGWNPELAEIPGGDPTFQTWRWLSELGRLVDQGARR